MEQHDPVPPLIFVDAQADIMLEKIVRSRCQRVPYPLDVYINFVSQPGTKTRVVLDIGTVKQNL
jgi:hypothetical protein